MGDAPPRRAALAPQPARDPERVLEVPRPRRPVHPHHRRAGARDAHMTARDADALPSVGSLSTHCR